MVKEKCSVCFVGGRTEVQVVTRLLQKPDLWNGLNSDFIIPFWCLDIKNYSVLSVS